METTTTDRETTLNNRPLGLPDTRATGDGGVEAPLLAVRDLKRSFGGVRAVAGVSITVPAGQTVSVIGPNGSGKTTLFNLITGVLKPDAGSVTIDGEATTGWSPERIAQKAVARTFQNGRVFGNMTVRENVLLGRFTRLKAARPWPDLRRAPVIRWVPLLAETALALTQPPAVRVEARENGAIVDRQLARFGERLAPRKDQLAYSLSYANRRRTEIARALAMEPRLLLLDEPTAGMNPTETSEVIDQIKVLQAEGQSILLIEHKLDLVMTLSDYIYVMDRGEVIAEGTPTEVQNNARVVEAYLGRKADTIVAPGPEMVVGDAAPIAEATPTATERAEHPLLELREVDVYYGAARALDRVSLHVNPGEIVCLLGGNASGKSTTMKVSLGLIPPRSGTVAIDGVDATRMPTAERIKSGLASVPEARRIFPEMTVEENLLMGSYLRRDRRAVQEDVERMYALFPRLAERKGQPAGVMSGGEQQMLAMARALMSRPRLICMDEPTMGLAPSFVDRVLENIVLLNQQGVSVFMVEQNASLALSIAHRGYVIQNGAIVLSGAARDLLNDPAVQEAYLGKRVGE